MKYLFVTLMGNARAEMPGPGDIFAVCCQSYSPNGMTRYGRYTHLDDMSALTQWDKRCCLPQHHGTGNSKAAKRDFEYGSGDLPGL